MDRYKEIDEIKGLGIVLVVMLHIGMQLYNARFFNLFHMALFYFTAGYCFNSKYLSNSRNDYYLKRVKGLLVPYWCYNALLVILNNFFLKIHFYTDDERFLTEDVGIANFYGLDMPKSFVETVRSVIDVIFFVGGVPKFGGTSWFLISLFWVSCLFYMIEKVIISRIPDVNLSAFVRHFIAFVLLIVGYYAPLAGLNNRYSLLTSFSMYFVYVLGYDAKMVNYFEWLNKSVLRIALQLVVSIGVLAFLATFAEFGISTNQYGNPILLILASVYGCACISSIVVIVKKFAFLCNAFVTLGKASLFIMLLHFLCFKLITFIEIIFYHRNLYLLASFPVLFTHKLWWWLYAASGIMLPVLIYYLEGVVRKLKQQI